MRLFVVEHHYQQIEAMLPVAHLMRLPKPYSISFKRTPFLHTKITLLNYLLTFYQMSTRFFPLLRVCFCVDDTVFFKFTLAVLPTFRQQFQTP